MVNIKVEDLFANNYSFNESKLDVIVFDDWITFKNVESTTPIKDIKKSDKKYGIIIEKNPVTGDFTEIKIRTPERAETRVTVYDNVGNVVFEATTMDDKVMWDLRNSAGRNVANGSYLVTAQVRGGSGKTYTYSAKLGVRR
jgi:flagellar hook assembly protein FlgD